jgi:hypothetical protein
MTHYESESNNLSSIDRLDQVTMSADKRRAARASMRQAELVVDGLMRASADFRQLFAMFKRGIDALGRRGRMPTVKPELKLR